MQSDKQTISLECMLNLSQATIWLLTSFLPLQSSELADEFDGAAAVPRMSMPVSERKPVVSPIGTRLPSSKRARKRRHSSAPSMHYPRQEPAYQMQRASSYCENGGRHLSNSSQKPFDACWIFAS